jgi:hypothetical protein
MPQRRGEGREEVRGIGKERRKGRGAQSEIDCA